MPKINVDHESKIGVEEAYKKIKEFFENDQDLRKLDPKLKVAFKDSDRTGTATASQFSANIQVKATGAGSTVSVVVDLPLLLSPFKGKVQETLEKKLKKHLA